MVARHPTFREREKLTHVRTNCASESPAGADLPIRSPSCPANDHTPFTVTDGKLCVIVRFSNLGLCGACLPLPCEKPHESSFSHTSPGSQPLQHGLYLLSCTHVRADPSCLSPSTRVVLHFPKSWKCSQTPTDPHIPARDHIRPFRLHPCMHTRPHPSHHEPTPA